MRFRRRSVSFQSISQVLCISLLLQGSGIAQALPLPAKQTFVSKSELESPRLEGAVAGSESSSVRSALDRVWTATAGFGAKLGHWLEDRWAEPAPDVGTPVRVAQAGGTLPLPPRLISAVLASSGQGQAAPPSPPSLGAVEVEETPPAELASLLGKSATEQIPLLAGLNLVSIPEEPVATDPAAVFAAVAGDLSTVVAAATCNARGPWLRYDPADPAASDLTAIDHRIGMWVSMTAAAALPSDGTLPASTTIELCSGWNLIGFPAAEPRHPQVALASIADKWQRIFGYDAFDPDDPWEVFSIDVPAWANDLEMMKPGRGYWLLATEDVTLEIRNGGPPPTVAIASPADLAVVTGPTEIVGTVESDRLASWTLTSRAIGDGDAVTLATGNAPVSGGTLATFDPTLLLNGLYELELTATDVQGQQVSDSVAVAVEGQMKIGYFTLSFIDLAVPVSGLDVEIVRTYDSRDQQPRDFGVGWSLDVRQGSVRHNRTPGDGWQLQTGLLPCDTVLESKSHLTVVRLSDQEVYRFALRLFDGTLTGGGCFATARFDFIDGPMPGTTLEILGNDEVFYENGSDQVIDSQSFEPLVPQDVRLTTRDGRIFELDLDDGVTLLEDQNGNRLTITPAGITHTTGLGITFDRDAAGRITAITDPLSRTMTYAYDAAADLVSFTDRAGTTTRFTYGAGHYLEMIENALGVPAVRSEYDAGGRLIRIVDAAGQATNFTHEVENRREVSSDRLGFTQVLELDRQGNVLREIDELGGVTALTWDGDGHLLTETDAEGLTTTYSYDSQGLLTEVQDPGGRVTSFTRNSRGQPLTVTDAAGETTVLTYDSKGNLLTTTDPTGAVTNRAYDAAGNMLSVTNPLGGETSFEYDPFGRQTRVVNPLGHASEFTYNAMGEMLTRGTSRTLPGGGVEELTTSFDLDDLGRRIATTRADGSVRRHVFDALGRVREVEDALGRKTTFTYDATNRLTQTLQPDGTTSSYLYDAEGRRISATDDAGRQTTFTWDGAGRMTSSTLPDGAVTRFGYDGVGRLTERTDARGSITRYTYDAADQVTRVVDALGGSRQIVYDAVGNPIEETDPLGRTSLFSYDPTGRLVEVTRPDGTTLGFTYDAAGRRTSETDPNGRQTLLAYDDAGRLLEVTDALGGVTSYAYDELGNRVLQTDARGNSTRFEYDRLGHPSRRVLPDGASETFAYDTEGRRVLHVDMAGAATSFVYDSADRLVERGHADGSVDRFTYTPSGQVATVTDARGLTRYGYDARDRPTSIELPEGWTLAHTWDPGGHLLSTSANRGAESLTSSYAYDALGRMAEVTNSQARTFRYTWDAAGQRTTLEYPNGVTTSYAYDAVGRLVDLQTVAADGSELQSFAYTLDATGNNLSVLESDQTLRSYEYDALNRLVRERVTDPDASLQYENVFTYDAIGNRLSQGRGDSDGNVQQISYSYDARDRLIGESHAAGSITYSWDANGNLLSSDWLDAAGQPETSRQYQWQRGDRLSKAILDDGTEISYSYDSDGILWRRNTLSPTGEADETRYLVDGTGDFSRVFADLDSAGDLAAHYPRGAGGIALAGRFFDDGSEPTFHQDGLGSTRTVSTTAGTLAASHDFEAFGGLLDSSDSTASRLLFTGEPLDPQTGLYYLRARWMDPRTGRFLSTDPHPGDTRTPVTLHRYLYAGAQPVNNVDPSGEFFTSLNVGLGIMPSLAFWFSGAVVGVSSSQYPPLPGDLAQEMDDATDKILQLVPKKSCTNKVINKLAPAGFDLGAFKDYLKLGWFFYDGTRAQAKPKDVLYSTEAGATVYLKLRWKLPADATIADVFAAARKGERKREKGKIIKGKGKLLAITSMIRKQLTVFFNPEEIYGPAREKAGLIFHEGLHGWSSTLGGTWGDTQLKTDLGLTVKETSENISFRITTSCF